MEDGTTRSKESVSLAAVANMGDELEEGRTPGSDLNHAEDRNDLNEASQEPLSGRRTQQAALRVRRFHREHAQLFRWICIGLLCTAFAAFLLTACILNFQKALPLFVLTCVVLAFLAYSLLKRWLGPNVLRCATPWGHSRRRSLWFKRGIALAAFLALVLWLALDTSQRPEQLVSFAGICVFIGILFACSKHHRAVSWRTVSWGLGLQFVLGLFVIRTEPGFIAFRWLGDQIQTFLSYTKAGSKFVFGEALIKDVFAFQVLPIIVFFSCVMSILYYLGLMQWLILKIAWLMQVTMRTTAPETLSVAGNIFVSQTEAPLLIRPYLEDMTLSEVHVVMTGGYATIAGSLLGAYISFGIDAASLIAASVMAAPCALALSKLVYPEVEESRFRNEEGVQLSSGEAQNILEAASSGAAISVNVIANIVANLIAFLAVLDFINATFSWLGDMVNIQGLSFQLICSYILRPVAFLMGVAWEDCPVVSELLGIKLFLNEFVAYEKLSKYKNRRLTGVEEWIGGEKQWISVRAEILTTYALCGFANLSSIGIMLGGLASMVPQRKSDFSQIVLRALFTGACVSLMNACVAGILYVPREAEVNCTSLLNTTLSSTSFDVYQCCRKAFQSTSPEFSLDNCCRFYNHTTCP
ncbi:Sodium/nucleoside cotransporter 1 [Myotis brandtii]|uniref:Sodium/nucleoside cotransporter n=1 Tax=Myotis brandtii TaxID=109478 RepID=S7NFR8_MYOBR|nr:PREDICTED: sodium/nucleoside cotransporter 1 isoform X1 [Myotis brandtii]XP_005878533.1 PREDICTED: sodium/nucleoside cotransporter 1 isoform X1 [Myotis brandtii]XP_005878534.1 PREDICTED: sodium/nucleoside cotransporter 1 isoform X1 [Myotis brandtii]EPQ15295.1 Sodium/nucleoside cotransporter 1 [Myotis brandtii]